MTKAPWIKALREAAQKYRAANPGTLFNPYSCPLCDVAFSLNEDWENRCESCMFYSYKCHYQPSFKDALHAYKSSETNTSTEIDDDTFDLLLIRAEELDVLADNIETVPNEFFPTWIEDFNVDNTPIEINEHKTLLV